ncbi:hypothetical protein B0H63DRAFT_183466 [Podospora didyma]|uniref:Uncharacterized protein n=1 Tax=Podospora didyma TaxID=330526 RepID=A0AAE0NPT1_9PEZI|nr:hypothetical protein B0H63DRAFT_183466 [Podospora didyma]
MDFLDFDMGRVSIPSETTLFELLSQCLAKFVTLFNINDSQGLLSDPSSLERMLRSIFDTDSRAFVTERSLRILAGLDGRDKACLFVQAVAGMTLIFQRLESALSQLSPRLFSRELQLFAESEQRRNMLEKVDGSPLFGSCYSKNTLVDFLAGAVSDREASRQYNLPSTTIGEDINVAWGGSRPCKNMGLPWGFTIMAIN